MRNKFEEEVALLDHFKCTRRLPGMCDEIMDHGGGCVDAGGLLPPGGKPQHLAAPGVLPQQMGEVLTPRKQAVVDRLRRRIENYRRRQTDFMPRFDQTFNGLCEQNIQETLLLKQKFLENKAKRTAKKQDKKQSEIPNNIQNNLLAASVHTIEV
ncbi:hypothetical protein Phum_PHUM217000 [Pediculus humanus corporis]|uniref:Neurogenic mastermind-like N-terminal domain-containing protein n=1 Tax=Pediculus humanus subsp. corporis TaxID=121224 RepID=E0VHX7_PEDHC|nr:uncharacterized protein Phum_PHUM217000 [Pediculus humanus corporis]EEB12983.1 hypothetical protein Phum_PHUM217000 [Pediculus humanus corporis]